MVGAYKSELCAFAQCSCLLHLRRAVEVLFTYVRACVCVCVCVCVYVCVQGV